MQLWFTEKQTRQVRFSIKVNKQLFSGNSGFQKIDVFESAELGRILTLDGYTMLTEKDEFIYHEMITHVPMAAQPDVKKALVIGGGDGGTVRELARYQTVESIDLVEIDRLVIDVCKDYLPFTSCGLEDERVHIFIQDGAEYVKNVKNQYELIVVDSTDPVGIGEELFTKEFYENCYNALKDNGVMVNQLGTPFYYEDSQTTQRSYKRIIEQFPIVKAYQAHIPTYASGHWLFGFASKQQQPVNDLSAAKWNSLGIKTKYCNAELLAGAFALPTYVIELLTR
ncbi:MAG: polyamine aminopropyltransferase [Deferribacteraceae bacterium]|nr:polyamine aminopropyltransferase [Deferribacteraceae bacterium]